MDLQENLASAQSAIESAEVVRPSSEELTAISTFCKAEVKRRQAEVQLSEEIKLLRVQQKTLKMQLTKDITKICTSESANAVMPKCVAISKEDAKKFELFAKEESIEPLEPYARIIQVNKDSSITPEVIQEALENVSTEDLEEAATAAAEDGQVTSKTTIRHLVLTSIRRIIRSYTETLKISDSLPRGSTVYDVLDAPQEIADRMWKLWCVDQKIKKNLVRKKPVEVTYESSLKTKIESFFIRTGLTAQRIVVEGHPYRLVRRISVRKPKIGVGRFEQILDASLEETDVDNMKNFKPLDFMKTLQIQLSSVPAESKSNVVLCKIAEE